MKAVIMAGGEGTRLRPLTSNAPKPMLPLVNRPMMEHIVDLLKRHGIDEIVVTVAFMANAIRDLLRRRLRVRRDACAYATEETPLGTAGSVRNAMEQLDERFLVISGDVLTDIDLGAIVDFHDEQGRHGHHRPRPRREPARVRHRHHPARTARSSASSRSPPGARCSPTPSTPASTCSSPRSSTTSRPTGRSTSPARCSPRCSTTASRCSAPSPRATGRTSAPSRPTCGPTRTSSTARSRCRHPRLRDRPTGVWVGEGAEVHPDATIDRARRHRRQLPHRGRRHASGEYTVLGSNVRVRSDAELERTVRARQRLPRRRRAPPRHRRRPVVRPPQRRPHRGGRRDRRRVLRRRRGRSSARA